jgi:hypothetical protein
MKKFRLTKEEQQKISSEEIKRYKDFASLTHNYQRLTKRNKKRLYQDPKLFIFILLLLLILLLVFMESDKKNEINDAQPEPTEQRNEVDL